MYFDNLSLAGIAVVALYGLLPFVFGRETLRVEEEGGDAKLAAATGQHRPTGPGCPGEPCPGA